MTTVQAISDCKGSFCRNIKKYEHCLPIRSPLYQKLQTAKKYAIYTLFVG